MRCRWDRYGRLRAVQGAGKAEKTVLESIEQQEKLTQELRKQIEHCTDLRELEDIYLPYKPKKQTRASKAKAKGLEPLAAMLMKQDNGDVWDKAARFVKNDVENEEEALQGARDIIANGSARMTGQETPCVALLTGGRGKSESREGERRKKGRSSRIISIIPSLCGGFLPTGC